MPSLDSYHHRPATHCGAGALRNVSDFYNWGYDEAACFGLGAGLVFDALARSHDHWPTVRPSAAWLVEAFFENLEIPHFVGENDDWHGAWDDVADTIDSDDPAVLFLDSEELAYLPDEDNHPFPHVVVLIGYDDEDVQFSDASQEEIHSVPRETLRDAWTIDGVVSHERKYLTVTRARQMTDAGTAAARSINQTVDYFQHALDAPRTTGTPGDEGIPALRSFAADLPAWSDLDDPEAAARATVHALDWHGEGTALRGLYAESLGELAPRAGLGGGWSDQLADVADEWRSVIDLLRTVHEDDADTDLEATFEEAGSVLAATVEREEQFFDRLDREI